MSMDLFRGTTRQTGTIRWRRVPVALPALLLVLAMTLPAMGAEGTNSEPGTPQHRTAEEDSEAAATGQDNAHAGADTEPTSDVFVPSEEISEDFAVAFPVDI